MMTREETVREHAESLQRKYQNDEGYLGVYQYNLRALYALILSENRGIVVFNINYAVAVIKHQDARTWIIKNKNLVRIL